MATRAERAMYPLIGASRKWFIRVEWKPRDVWVGVFWKTERPWTHDVWVCVLPCLPVHFGWRCQIKNGG